MSAQTVDDSHHSLPGCAALTRELGEPLAGTATAIRSWLLLEQRGPWSLTAREDVLRAALPPERHDQLTALAATKGLRPLLVRRPGRSRTGPLTVLMASSLEGRTWVERRMVDDLAELDALDLAQLADGVPGQGEPVEGPVYLVCTHGAKDLCCAVQGRPVAAALAAVAHDAVWECTHLGGHRFAANVAVLPDGLLYGQVPVERVTELALAHRSERLVPDLLRGRSRDEPAAQAAEIAVRRERGLTGLADVQVLGTEQVQARVLVHLRALGEVVDVTVEQVPLGCGGATSCAGRTDPTALRAHILPP